MEKMNQKGFIEVKFGDGLGIFTDYCWYQVIGEGKIQQASRIGETS